MKIKELTLLKDKKALHRLPSGKLLINTINAHSFNVAQEDKEFSRALLQGDVLIPDGVGIIWATRLLNLGKLEKVAGADLFKYEMDRLNNLGGTCFFLGSSETTLQRIKEQASIDYPNINVAYYSPPYKAAFSEDENRKMIHAVNRINPDLLWIGMTAPKQEKWGYENYHRLEVKGHIGCIGAVFDFYAGNIKRAPEWMVRFGLEWFYRLLSEPRRMWKRYLVGNLRFVIRVIGEYLGI